jgi:hypothetical protein
MTALLFLGFLILIGPLALWLGVDSRDRDPDDVRGWWPAAPSRSADTEFNRPSAPASNVGGGLCTPAGSQELLTRPEAKAPRALHYT